MEPEHHSPEASTTAGSLPPADRLLLEQIRVGDPDAGYRFIRNYYPGVYRYLLYLTGSPDTAEDLTQETFLQAWRRLGSFEGRAALRTWLHRIAHREFLQALRSQPPQVSLEEAGEIPEPRAAHLTETVELRAIIGRLPIEERELVVLHYLEGYQYDEIVDILRIPLGRVRQRLAAARARLQQELGEGDLSYLNETTGGALRRWSWLPLDAVTKLETRLSRTGGWLRRGETGMNDQTSTGMSRRNLLEAAGTAAASAAAAGLGAAAGAAAPRNEAEVIDDRLTRKVTLAASGMALADLCDQLRRETGVALAAGPSVADEKVTLFCEKRPLREVMRQLSRPFGYTWLRSGTPGQYRYELVQELRSQLMEEELRNRDRNMALLVLEREIERYRPYLDLSPDEALERAKNAPPEEKKLLETLAGAGWGPIHMYFRLTPQELADLRAGQELNYVAASRPGDSPVPVRPAPRPLPADLARYVLQSLRGYRVRRASDGMLFWTHDETDPTTMVLTDVPETRAWVVLRLKQSQPGQYRLSGSSQFLLPVNDMQGADITLAVGTQAAVIQPDNAVINARWARDPALQSSVSVMPVGSHRWPAANRSFSSPPHAGVRGRAAAPDRDSAAEHVTTAEVLEALNRGTGLPIVADFFTHLYDPGMVSLESQPLFEVLNCLADRLRLRWSKDVGLREADLWLEFRSMSFYDDRLKEVPNRLLSRWATTRQVHGMLSLNDLCEIAQLPDTQLDAEEMAAGARELWGLAEWDLARNKNLRPHLRFLHTLTPDQRQATMRAEGLALERMSVSQQQQYIVLSGTEWEGLVQPFGELAGAVLRVEYTQPGWFEWRVPGEDYFQWVIPIVSGTELRRAPRPQIREQTPEAALAAARRLYPQGFEAEVQAAKQMDARFEAAAMVPQADQIVPTTLDLNIIYIPGTSTQRAIRWFGPWNKESRMTYRSYGPHWPVSSPP